MHAGEGESVSKVKKYQLPRQEVHAMAATQERSEQADNQKASQ
jgi:hypothetical protein